MLQRGNVHLTTLAKKLLYYGQVHSHLCYGIGIWGPMLSAQQLRDLLSIQKKCVKLINPSLPVHSIFANLQILDVKQLIELEQCKIGYKMCNNLLPPVLTRLLFEDHNKCVMTKAHSYSTSQKNIPNRPNAKGTQYCKSFLYQSIACYSGLPHDIRNVNNINLFVKRLKKFIITK